MLPPRSLPLAVLAGLALVPSPARADKFDRTLDLSVHPAFVALDVNDVELSLPASTAPWVREARPRLAGRASLVGAEARAGFTLSGLRLDVGAGAHGASGLRLRHPPVRNGLEAGGVWAVPLSASAVYALGSPRGFRPYAGLRGDLTVVGLMLTTINASTPVSTVVPGLSARLGVVIWLNEYFFADLGGAVGLVGGDVFRLSAGVGVPIPLANL